LECKCQKKCPFCLSKNTIKKGYRRGSQRFICQNCNKSFQNKRRPIKLQKTIWRSFVYKRSTINQLAREYQRSSNWVRKQLESYRLPVRSIASCSTVIIADATYFRRQLCILVFRSNELNKNILWREIDYERIDYYYRARQKIEAEGFRVLAIVTDGRPGIRGIFSDVPVQMCHFHQKQIVKKYLTSNPRLEAGIELRNISQTLCNTTECTG
jgi:hypothetical protein